MAKAPCIILFCGETYLEGHAVMVRLRGCKTRRESHAAGAANTAAVDAQPTAADLASQQVDLALDKVHPVIDIHKRTLSWM